MFLILLIAPDNSERVKMESISSKCIIQQGYFKCQGIWYFKTSQCLHSYYWTYYYRGKYLHTFSPIKSKTFIKGNNDFTFKMARIFPRSSTLNSERTKIVRKFWEIFNPALLQCMFHTNCEFSPNIVCTYYQNWTRVDNGVFLHRNIYSW